ncbi:MAG: relaxase/mobilization nuclease domain-containing protein, partial [Pseudomonadota bacterium]
MILKGSQRGNAANLSRHLMNARDNEHVELHELRGFASETLDGALLEAEAISKGTRCTQALFSLSLSPPQDETVSIETFEASIEMIEQRLGLEDQPRAIVFHEKEGRRHAHAVWSRIDAQEMKAVPLPFFKTRLMEVSKELYLEHGWDMPKGLISREMRNPLNFNRAEWQQAKRQHQDPRLI